MNISVLTSDPGHPVVQQLRRWQAEMTARGHAVSVYFDKKQLVGGDFLFLVSCGQIMRRAEREKFKAVLVLHASELPRGRGWSPHIWAILGGANRITVCLLEVADPVDSGAIWFTRAFELEGHELLPEINEKLFKAELELMTEAVERFDEVTPSPQLGEPGPYLQRRTPEHSRLHPDKTLSQQFDLLRVVDNTRYPAFLDHRGYRYLIKIEKVENEE